MDKLYSIFSTYFRTWNNVLSIIYFCSIRNWPCPSILERDSNPIFSKTKRYVTNKFLFCTFFLFFHKESLCACLHIIIRPLCIYKILLTLAIPVYVLKLILYLTNMIVVSSYGVREISKCFV